MGDWGLFRGYRAAFQKSQKDGKQSGKVEEEEGLSKGRGGEEIEVECQRADE